MNVETRIKAVDKRMINGKTDVNQLVPIKYKWAWEKYQIQCANHWMPQEIPMQRDIALWKDPEGLSDDERLIVKRNLGFFVTADSLAANNIVLGTYRQLTAPECRQFLLRQGFDEACHCYIEGTEILTENGFKDFRDLEPTELVAQYNQDGSIEFVHTKEIICDDYHGQMVEFKNERYHSIVTPNHRCVAIDVRNDSQLKIIHAQDFSPTNYNIPASGKTTIESHNFSLLERLKVAYQADGTKLNKHVKNVGAITGQQCLRFHLKKERKIARLEAICLHLDLRFTVKKSLTKEGYKDFYIWVPCNEIFDKDFQWVDITCVSAKWIDNFIEELKFWDGHERTEDLIVYTNTNRSAIDKVIELSILASKRHNLYITPASGNRRESYQLSIYNKDYYSGRTIEKTSIDYDGKVYCVAVPSGMIITRYNGKVTVSGNTEAYQYIVESLGLDEGEIFNAYHEIASIRDKDEFLIPFIDTLSNPEFKTGTFEADQQLLKSLIVFACIMEGMFFYVGFVQILALGRQNKMTGSAEQYQYILRDESQHCAFGVDVVNTIKMENPHLWTDAFKEELTDIFKKAVALEYAYAVDTMPKGILGLNPSMFNEYLRFICNRRMRQIGLQDLYPEAQNPFPWMSEVIDLRKEKNFFETRVTEYQTGGALEWD